MGILFNWPPVEPQLKVHIFPYVLYSIQLSFGGLIIIIFVEFLKLRSMIKQSGKKVTGQYFENMLTLMVLVYIYFVIVNGKYVRKPCHIGERKVVQNIIDVILKGRNGGFILSF